MANFGQKFSFGVILTCVIACSLKLGETLPFLQLKPKLATIFFFSEMLLFFCNFFAISAKIRYHIFPEMLLYLKSPTCFSPPSLQGGGSHDFTHYGLSATRRTGLNDRSNIPNQTLSKKVSPLDFEHIH